MRLHLEKRVLHLIPVIFVLLLTPASTLSSHVIVTGGGVIEGPIAGPTVVYVPGHWYYGYWIPGQYVPYPAPVIPVDGVWLGPVYGGSGGLSGHHEGSHGSHHPHH